MSNIFLEFDNTLEKSEIMMVLNNTSKAEMGNDYIGNGLTDRAQTAVFGVQVPLISINSTVIDADCVHNFKLSSVGVIPTASMTVEDKIGIINNIDKPGQDNEVRIQILPRFENAYKKIDLTFFITSIKVHGTIINLTCTYKLPAIMSMQYKSYGNLDTYTLFRNIAQESKLGFATNIVKVLDGRYAYCNNISLIDLMNREIGFADNSICIMDWWIDFWNNINLVDIKERYNSVDSIEDMKVWVAGQIDDTTAGNEPQPQLLPAVITTHEGYNKTELYAKDYKLKVSPGINVLEGTDKVFSVYNNELKDYTDFLVQDGDIKNDIFMKFEYVGENYGTYEKSNYLVSKHLRDAFIQKINTESIDVTLKSPLLGLMRGHKVNFIRYVVDDGLEAKMQSLENMGIVDRHIESNIPLDDYEITVTEGEESGSYKLDRTVSGQYLIYGTTIEFNGGEWEYKLKLVKPASNKASVLTTDN